MYLGEFTFKYAHTLCIIYLTQSMVTKWHGHKLLQHCRLNLPPKLARQDYKFGMICDVQYQYTKHYIVGAHSHRTELSEWFCELFCMEKHSKFSSFFSSEDDTNVLCTMISPGPHFAKLVINDK